MIARPESWRAVNEAVYYTDQPVAGLGTPAVRHLIDMLPHTPRQRVRVCTHRDAETALQEMMIVLGAGGYVRPHRHHGKEESLHVIEGRANLVLFDLQGEVTEHIQLGPYGSSACWYFRIGEPVFHTVIPETDCFVFHETTLGPFEKSATEMAPWAPEDEQIDGWHEYNESLKRKLGI